MCESKGIHLIHIFEDEWVKNKDIVKSIKIANRLASISVSKFGTYVLDENDINKVENHKE